MLFVSLSFVKMIQKELGQVQNMNEYQAARMAEEIFSKIGQVSIECSSTTHPISVTTDTFQELRRKKADESVTVHCFHVNGMGSIWLFLGP